MGYYKDKTIALMRSGRGDEDRAIKVVAMFDQCVFEPMRIEKPGKYWAFMRSMHEIVEGCHYDKDFAEWEVAQMSHTSKDGVVCKGAHWSMEAINKIFIEQKGRGVLKQSVTLYDFYVALHSWWHDNINRDVSDFGENAEGKNIERAIGYFFLDEDAPEGKIWRYYAAMRR